MMSVRPATCRCPTFSAAVLMLSTMLFKVRKQLSSSFQVWGSVYFCWFGVSLQVSNCIASGIGPQKKLPEAFWSLLIALSASCIFPSSAHWRQTWEKEWGRKHVRLFLAHPQIICTPAPMCAGACVCVCVREKGEKERERRRGKRKRRGRARKEEGEREGGEEGKERDRKIERERKRDRERMSWSEWWVCLSCWLRYSRCQKFCWKVHACSHDNIFALLKGVSLFKVPYCSPQEITYF